MQLSGTRITSFDDIQFPHNFKYLFIKNNMDIFPFYNIKKLKIDFF